jgi:hypothetical protein
VLYGKTVIFLLFAEEIATECALRLRGSHELSAHAPTAHVVVPCCRKFQKHCFRNTSKISLTGLKQKFPSKFFGCRTPPLGKLRATAWTKKNCGSAHNHRMIYHQTHKSRHFNAWKYRSRKSRYWYGFMENCAKHDST